MKNAVSPHSVLIIDDNPDAISPILYLVDGLQMTPYVAFDGLMALDIFRNKKIDHVIIDWNMPVMNGQQFIAELDNRLQKEFSKHNITKNIDFIIYTSYRLKPEEIPTTKVLTLKGIAHKDQSLSKIIKAMNNFILH